MWFDFDVKRFARMILPPILRGPVLLAFVRVLIIPIKDIYGALTRYREGVMERIGHTSHVNSLDEVLNNLFHLSEHQIFITTTEDLGKVYLRYKKENIDPLFFHGANQPVYLGTADDVPPNPTFVIHIPNFLCTSLNKDRDKYHGIYLNQITLTIDYYKPAGRTYRIELYDYE